MVRTKGISLNPKGRPDVEWSGAKVGLTAAQWANVLCRVVGEYGRDPRCGKDMYMEEDRVRTIIEEEVERGT